MINLKFPISDFRFCFALCLACISTHFATQADEAAFTLAGSWAGHWTDSRPEYGKSGGDFSGVAIEKEPGKWTATFNVGGARTFKVELKGKRDKDGHVIFDGAVDLGRSHGIYTWKGVIDKDGFHGEYDGPDEKGTFTMTRSGQH